MFFFGPLSTHLPYIILGLVYVVSVSIFSLKTIASNDEYQPDHKLAIIFNEAENTSGLANYYIEIFDQQVSDSFAETYRKDNINLPIFLLPPRPKLRVLKPACPLGFIAFGRPPPSV
jgi:hypothetical protein